MTAQALLGLAVIGLLSSQPTGRPATRDAEPRPVDLAICLDTSGSMNGLINAARQNIWAVVNDLALARPSPKLRIALLSFGNDGHEEAEGWVKVETAFTDDLDLVSEKLFALTTNGGEEYVGRVVQKALDTLSWSDDPNALQMIVVAGNEGADQDKEVDFRAICRRAIGQGIMINSIYCGNPADELAPVWRDVATLADGQFAAIEQDQGPLIKVTPFDEQINALSVSLNGTYIPYGKQGLAGKKNQDAQDTNAAGLNSTAAAQRAMTKASCNYSCGTWDLVDAMKDEKFDLTAIKVEELPENMRTMSMEDRMAFVKEMGEKRAGLQEQVADLTQKRMLWVAQELKKLAVDQSKSFDFAVRRAIRAQAEAKGFQLAKTPDLAEVTKGNENK